MISAKVIRKINSVEDPKLRDVFISILEEAERIVGETITKKEFQEFVKATEENFRRVWQAIDALTQRVNELTERVNELAEAQRRTEERLNRLTERVDRLAEAQQKTEERLNKLTERVDTLTERLDALTERVNELAEAQRRTEERLNRLTERVDSLTERVNELAEAQKRTEEKLGWLIDEHRKTRQELGGLAHTFGYILEDRAYKHIPGILKEKYQIEIEGKLNRKFFEVGRNRYVEVNIYGKGWRSGKEIHIVGECKSKLSKKDVDKFIKMIKGLGEELSGEKFMLFVTYHATPQVMEYVKDKGAHLILSSEFE